MWKGTIQKGVEQKLFRRRDRQTEVFVFAFYVSSALVKPQQPSHAPFKLDVVYFRLVPHERRVVEFHVRQGPTLGRPLPLAAAH